MKITTAAEYFTDLKGRMQKAGVSAAELARAAGKHKSQVVRWLNLQHEARTETMQQIEAAFQTLSRKR